VLAGGIAHDFNNLLGSILANAEVVAFGTAWPLIHSRCNSNNPRCYGSGSEIVRQMMAYAGQESGTGVSRCFPFGR
jgi:hypothetical protein